MVLNKNVLFCMSEQESYGMDVAQHCKFRLAQGCIIGISPDYSKGHAQDDLNCANTLLEHVKLSCTIRYRRRLKILATCACLVGRSPTNVRLVGYQYRNLRCSCKRSVESGSTCHVIFLLATSREHKHC